MAFKIKNEYGLISIDSEVVATVAGTAAMDCFGIVGMAAKNVKDGLVQLLKRESLTKGVKIKLVNEMLHIDFHIIVEYGISITAIGEILISNVKYQVEEYTGLKVENINIFVEGVRVDN